MNISLEPTASQLARYQLQVEELLYSTSTCYVYRAFDRSRNQHVVLKFLLMPVTDKSTEAMQREVENQMSCRHPNIVEMLECFWYYLSSTTWIAVLELELMAKDLMRDIQDRCRNQFPYPETLLFAYFSTLVDAFAFAQDKCIAHRDVKPQNLFLTGSSLKVGDFGSSRVVPHDPKELTLAGTPSYLSPILRQGLSANCRYIAHNPYKSDVYSLGLTFLHMMSLQCVSPFEDIKTAVPRIIQACQYSDQMKGRLNWMLTYEEANRPDFLALRSTLQGNTPSQQVSASTRFACEHSQTPNPVSLVCSHCLCKDCFDAQTAFLAHCIQIICALCRQPTEFLFGPSTVATAVGVTVI